MAANEIRSIDCCELQLVVAAESFINTRLTTSISVTLTLVIYMTCSFICAADIMSTFFIHKSFCQNKLLSLSIFCFFLPGLFLDDMQLLCSTSRGCLHRLEFTSFTLRLFLVYQQGFFLPTGLFRKI